MRFQLIEIKNILILQKPLGNSQHVMVTLILLEMELVLHLIHTPLDNLVSQKNLVLRIIIIMVLHLVLLEVLGLILLQIGKLYALKLHVKLVLINQ